MNIQAVLLFIGRHFSIREDTCQISAGIGPGQTHAFIELNESEESPKGAFLH